MTLAEPCFYDDGDGFHRPERCPACRDVERDASSDTPPDTAPTGIATSHKDALGDFGWFSSLPIWPESDGRSDA